MRSRTTPNGTSLSNPSNATCSEDPAAPLPLSSGSTRHPTVSAQSNPDPTAEIESLHGKLTPLEAPTIARARAARSIVPKPIRKTEVLITLQQFNPGRTRHTSARVLSFDTSLPPKDCLAVMQAMANLLANYQPKENPSV